MGRSVSSMGPDLLIGGHPEGATNGDRSLVDVWLTWLRSVGFFARSHVVLTFGKEELWDVGAERAAGMWAKLVKELNVGMCRRLGGNGARYKRWWGHSYFSYLMCLERQKRGTLHIHAVVDNWIDYEQLHQLWQYWCGFAYVRAVSEGDDVATRYVLKYITKVNSPGAVWLQRRRVEVPQVRRVKADEVVQAYLSEVVYAGAG